MLTGARRTRRSSQTLVASKPKKTPAQLQFAGWLKAHRDELNITAAEAAKKADVDATTWRALEAPGMPWHAPSARTIRGIANVFGVPAEEVAARAGVSLPHVDGYSYVASPAMPPEGMEMMNRLLEQLAEAHRLNSELLKRLDDAALQSPRQPRRPRPS